MASKERHGMPYPNPSNAGKRRSTGAEEERGGSRWVAELSRKDTCWDLETDQCGGKEREVSCPESAEWQWIAPMAERDPPVRDKRQVWGEDIGLSLIGLKGCDKWLPPTSSFDNWGN